MTFTALPATAAPAGPAQRLCPEPPHRSDRLTSKSVKSGEDEALLTSQSQDEEGDIAKPRDTALKRGGERCRPPGAPGTQRPLGPTDAQTGLGPCGPSDPSPNHPVLAPSIFSQACALHSMLSTHVIQTTHPLLSAPTELSRHRPRHTDGHLWLPVSSQSVPTHKPVK